MGEPLDRLLSRTADAPDDSSVKPGSGMQFLVFFELISQFGFHYIDRGEHVESRSSGRKVVAWQVHNYFRRALIIALRLMLSKSDFYVGTFTSMAWDIAVELTYLLSYVFLKFLVHINVYAAKFKFANHMTSLPPI
jgi:hypothetical protein